MLRLFEHLRIDVCQRHIIHRSLVCQVCTVFVVTHTDGSTRRVLVLTNQITGIYTLGFQTRLYQVTKAIVADHATECHFSAKSCRIRCKNSRRRPQGQGHLLGKFLFADLGFTLDLIQDQIHVQLA